MGFKPRISELETTTLPPTPQTLSVFLMGHPRTLSAHFQQFKATI